MAAQGVPMEEKETESKDLECDLQSPAPRQSLVSCASSLRFPILQAALQPLKLRTHARFPDSLFCVLGHTHRITGCNRRIFVVQAAQLPEQKQPLHVR
jgi:hypothetical protein